MNAVHLFNGIFLYPFIVVPIPKATVPAAPTFVSELEHKEVFESMPITLECAVTGHPEPTITWYQVRSTSISAILFWWNIIKGPFTSSVCDAAARLLPNHKCMDSVLYCYTKHQHQCFCQIYLSLGNGFASHLSLDINGLLLLTLLIEDATIYSD